MNVAKTVFGGKFITLSFYVTKEGKSQINKVP